MKRDAWIILGLLAISFGAFSGVWIWRCGFVNFDDYDYIVRNPHVTTGLCRTNFVWAWKSFEQGNYLPLTWLSFMADVSLLGARPAGDHAAVFHSVNVVFHAINAVLLYLVFKEATGDIWRSALLAAIFAVHPLRVESVVWVVERKDVLSGFFAFLTMLAYLRCTRMLSGKWYAATLLLFAATLLSKQVLATLPCALLLMDFWPLGRWEKGLPAAGSMVRRRCSLPDLLAEKLPLLLMSAGILIVTARAQGASGAISDLRAVPLSIRLANVPVSYVRYLGKMAWFGNLTVFYPLHAWGMFDIISSSVLLTVITLLCAASIRCLPNLMIGWLWFLGVLVPMIGLVHFGHVTQAMADRFTYFSGLGLLVMLIWSIPEMIFRQREIFVTAAITVLGVLSIFTIEQTRHWHDTATLWTRATEADDSATAELNLGGALFEDRTVHDKRPAMKHLAKAVLLDPNKANAQASFATALAATGNIAPAIAHMSIAVAQQPDNLKWQTELASWLIQDKQYAQAELRCRAALALHPDSAEIHRLLGVALAAQNRVKSSMQELK